MFNFDGLLKISIFIVSLGVFLFLFSIFLKNMFFLFGKKTKENKKILVPITLSDKEEENLEERVSNFRNFQYSKSFDVNTRFKK